MTAEAKREREIMIREVWAEVKDRRAREWKEYVYWLNRRDK